MKKLASLLMINGVVPTYGYQTIVAELHNHVAFLFLV